MALYRTSALDPILPLLKAVAVLPLTLLGARLSPWDQNLICVIRKISWPGGPMVKNRMVVKELAAPCEQQYQNLAPYWESFFCIWQQGSWCCLFHVGSLGIKRHFQKSFLLKNSLFLNQKLMIFHFFSEELRSLKIMQFHLWFFLLSHLPFPCHNGRMKEGKGGGKAEEIMNSFTEPKSVTILKFVGLIIASFF